MKSFKIKKICGDGYERWAQISMDSSQEEVCVHFLEYSEYLDKNNISSKKIGDILIGNLSIALVSKFRFVDESQKGYLQKINTSSSITAIGKIKEILDTDSVKCEIEGLGDDILVEFESDVDLKVGVFIELEGSLEFALV